MHGGSSFKPLSSGPAVTRYPCAVDHAGHAQPRPTFESLSFISQAPTGPAVTSFKEWVEGPAKGKTLRERITGKAPEAAAAATAQRAYLVGLRKLLNAEATPELLETVIAKDKHRTLIAFLDAFGDPAASVLDSKAGLVELSLQAGDVLNKLQTQARQAFDDAVKAGRHKAVDPKRQALVIYAAINVALDDSTRFAERHQVRTVSPAPELSPEARRLARGAYDQSVAQALKQGRALTPALLEELANDAVRELQASFEPTAGAAAESAPVAAASTTNSPTRYAATAFLAKVDAFAPQQEKRGMTEQREDGVWVFTEAFKQRQLGDFMKSLADFMLEVDAGAGTRLVDVRLEVFFEQMLEE
ncbi:hypothetical protein [Ramlibacter rhizophilus]|uniref:Uncharacterized protein n=1 Tax=Ramlibacter rhizophilus TaxID=1781167 RepID=A0A4Z0BPI5_9BURK|nr:hypothetical protein [Ramlibacter rhizophilus]TFZ01217.1 hypothetical protein EZ242_07490 [Ramlibacter rhizophilus]